ncbi:MAG: hypothetical protein KC910_37675 [Candidatus Eremiobacteraeota bacterium]|nr:hypothetical protein [Candidatus Eremiobacteraeota bacterium]
MRELFKYPVLEHPIARTLVSRLLQARSTSEAAWCLDEELERWFGHRRNLDHWHDDRCVCDDIADWVLPQFERFLARDDV